MSEVSDAAPGAPGSPKRAPDAVDEGVSVLVGYLVNVRREEYELLLRATAGTHLTSRPLTRGAAEAGSLAQAVDLLTRQDPRLRTLFLADAATREREDMRSVLTHVLLAAPPLRNELQSIVFGPADAPPTAVDAERPSLRNRFRDSFHHAWLAKPTAVMWMHVIIAAPVVVLMLTVWGGIHRPHEPKEVGVAALRVFAVWALSFLPGWLYVRFLGQRAGALWNEFVINLHRLGWDRPRYLPQPPKASAFYHDWKVDKGERYAKEANLYRQKFDAYYGKSRSDEQEDTDFAVRTDTMFPVFLFTGVLAVCWSAVLWDPSFVQSPSSVWDVLKFGFVGAYAFIAQSLVRRFFQSDLKPSAYASAVLRIVVVLLTVSALSQLLPAGDYRAQSVVAFVVGFFPIVALQALTRAAASTLRAAVPQVSPDYPLNQIDGLNIWYEARLIEESIEDMQNLVASNLVDVVLHTRVPVGRLVDWLDQAVLYLHLNRAERTWSERRAARKTSGGPPEASTEQPSSGGSGRRPRKKVAGKTEPLIGKQMRIELRKYGIRTATDLLKTFPPEQVDPLAGARSEPAGPAFDQLCPADLDLDWIRTLCRVLSEDCHLAPVWNWQSCGISARDERRRPRSAAAR